MIRFSVTLGDQRYLIEISKPLNEVQKNQITRLLLDYEWRWSWGWNLNSIIKNVRSRIIDIIS